MLAGPGRRKSQDTGGTRQATVEIIGETNSKRVFPSHGNKLAGPDGLRVLVELERQHSRRVINSSPVSCNPGS